MVGFLRPERNTDEAMEMNGETAEALKRLKLKSKYTIKKLDELDFWGMWGFAIILRMRGWIAKVISE